MHCLLPLRVNHLRVELSHACKALMYTCACACGPLPLSLCRLAFQSEAPLLLAHLTCAFPPPREAAKAGRASKDGSDLPRSPITDAPAASPRTAKAIFSGLTPNRSFAVAFPQIAFAPLLPSSALAQQPNGGNGGGSSTGSGSTVLCNVPFEDSTLTVELQYRVRPLLR